MLPAAVQMVNVADPLVDLWVAPGGPGRLYRSLLAVAHLDGDPIGTASVPVDHGGLVSHGRLASELRAQLDVELAPLATREHNGGGHGPGSSDRQPRGRERSVSVVITTCCAPLALERCLRSVLACDHSNFEVIVVENRPSRSPTRRMLSERFRSEPRLSFTEEHRRGLSWARNAGLARAQGEVVAFTDDDVVVDPLWVRRCAEAFDRANDVACVTGLILPLELGSQSQLLLEQFAGFGKGFVPRTFRLADTVVGDPFPYTPGVVGSGANTAVRTDVARALDGFDVALGAGTPALGGEDLDLYVRLALEGHALAYEPRAMVWHEHPDGPARLRRQVYRYGVSLGAMLTKQLAVGPGRRDLLEAVPAGIRYARDPASRKNAAKQADFPRRLDWIERLGMLAGPAAYAASTIPAGWHSTHARAGRADLSQAAIASATAACVVAPLLVALGVRGPLTLLAMLAFACLVPGSALLILLGGRMEPGLILGTSLAGTAIGAQAMVWAGVWWPKTIFCLFAAFCLGPLTAGLQWRPRFPRISFEARSHGALVCVALLAWGVSVAAADTSETSGIGLLAALPPTYFLAFALLLAGFAAAISRPGVDPKLLWLYVVGLVVVIHATTPLLYDEPRYTWTYKHIGVVEQIAAFGSTDRAVDIYNNWPAFFGAVAWLSNAAGVPALDFAEWAQVFFNLVAVVALRFALRGLTGDERLIWTATWLFLLANWVGQDYLAPQAFGFVLSLVVIGICLRQGPHARAVPLSSAGAIVVGGLCYLAVVTSHQLSPIVLLGGVTALALLTHRVPLWVPATMLAVELWWLALAWPYVGDYFSLFDIDPAQSTAPPGGEGLPGLQLVQGAARGVTLVVAMLAVLGLVRRLRAGRSVLAPAVLVLVPAALVLLQSYGGEGPFRAYLFALPWLCFFAAAACAPPLYSRLPEFARPWRLGLSSAVIGVGFLFAYFGLELANRVSSPEVEAAVWFEQNAPPDSLLVGLTLNFPQRLSARYADVHSRDYPGNQSLAEKPAWRNRTFTRADIPRLERALQRYGVPNTYVFLTPSQERYGRLYGIVSPQSRPTLEQVLRGSPSFRLAYRGGGASIFELRRGAP